jgi:hypothetical protein
MFLDYNSYLSIREVKAWQKKELSVKKKLTNLALDVSF